MLLVVKPNCLKNHNVKLMYLPFEVYLSVSEQKLYSSAFCDCKTGNLRVSCDLACDLACDEIVSSI